MNNNTKNRCKNKQLLFSFNDKITADFKGGDITSDGGAVLLREFDKKISFIKGLNKCINDPRDPLLTIHKQEELLRQRMFQITLGYKDADDSDVLRQDPLFQLSVKEDDWRLIDIEELASQPTITRLENRVQDKELDEMNKFLTDTYIKSVGVKGKHPETITLDIDSTDAPTHGAQQLSFFHGYYEETMYHPLLITEIESKLLLGAYLRPGNVHTAHEAEKYISPVVNRLKSAFPATKIILREDSGFSSPKPYNYCKREGLFFAIGVATNKVLERKIEKYLTKARQLFEEGNQETVKLYVSFRYKAESWDRQQRIAAKIEINKHGEEIRYVATNIKGRSKDIYAFYTKRGECENRIEELKNGFSADRLSCHKFYANYFRLLLHSCAYNFIMLLKRNVKSEELADVKIDTFRIKVLKVGAWIKETVRKIWVHFSSAWPFRNLFEEIYWSIINSPPYSLA